MENEYLPIGSIVLLKNAKKRVMITGFYVSSQEVNSDKVYDYVGCLYPEGVISSSQNLVFNNDQISQIVFVGYRDIEEQLFKEELFKTIKEKNNKLDKKDNEKTDVNKEKQLEKDLEIEKIETSLDEEPEIEEMYTSLDDDLNLENAGILFGEEHKLDDIESPLDEEKIIEKTNLNNERNVKPSIYDELEVLDPDKLFESKEVEHNDDLEVEHNDDLEVENGKFFDFENDFDDINSLDDDLLYGNNDNKELEKVDF